MAEVKENPKDARATKLKRWWTLAEHAHNPWAVQGKEDLDFYLGGEKQWASADLQLLRKEKRPVLTFNHLLALVNLVAGYQRQNRQDIKIYNRKGGSKGIANILTEIIKHIHDNCYGDWETAMAFLLGIITGKGYIGAIIDFDEDPYGGDIVLRSLSPFRIFVDPFFERYDMSDAEFVFQTSWLPKSRIELVYPEKKKDLEGLSVDENDKQPLYTEGDKYKDAAGENLSEIEKWRYRVKQCWWREFKAQHFLVGLESGRVFPVDFSMEKIKMILKAKPTLRHIKRVQPVLNLTTYVGNTELEHVEDPLSGITRIPIVPFWAYWLESNHFGIITQLKDPQREINKRISQTLHHLNQSANSGWVADDNALTDWTLLENFGSKPGIIIKKKKGSYLERINPTPISDAHLTLAQAGKQNIRDVSGINPDLSGVAPEKGESGYLMELRRNQGLVSLETIFDNFRMTKQVLGTLLVDMIQKTDAYTKQEMISIVLDGQVKEIQLREGTIKSGIDQIKNDLSIGKYKAVVSQSPHSPTIRMKNFSMLVEAAKAGLPIPAEVLVEASDLPMKEEIKKALAERRAAEAAAGGGPGAGTV